MNTNRKKIRRDTHKTREHFSLTETILKNNYFVHASTDNPMLLMQKINTHTVIKTLPIRWVTSESSTDTSSR